jgi:predicted molibdopterin-dependent oxidoreductase YjgC
MEVMADLGSRFVGGPDFDIPSPTVAMDELRRATTGAPADISSLPLGADLTESRGMQWPVPDLQTALSGGTPRRHMGQDGGTGFPTPTGKALLLPQEHPGLRRSPDPSFPMTAIASLEGTTWWDGLQYAPWGGGVVRPRELEGAYIEVSPEDASGLGLAEGSLALVTSKAGEMELPVRVGPSGMAQGHVFLAWGADREVQVLAPSLPLDGDGVSPWSTFSVRVEPVLL